MRRLLLILMLLSVTIIHAQEAPPDDTPTPEYPAPVDVTLRAHDRRPLQASYYAPPSDDAPAVLLLHQLYTNRSSWDVLIPHLQANGYAVLAVDLRGYGATRGDIDWPDALLDTVLWLEWLGAQAGVNPARVVTAGSSMGANLAVIGCADANAARPGACAGAAALSAGRNYFGYTPLAPALETGVPTLFVTARNDGYAALAAQELPPAYPNITLQWRDGNAHGIALLDNETIGILVDWLNARSAGG